MLQRKPLSKWTSRDFEEWRRKLGELIVLAYKAGNAPQAKQIIKQYKEGKITYREARKRLEKLASK